MERLSPLFNHQGLLGSSKISGYRLPSTTESLRICIRPMLFTKKLFRWIIVPCQIWKKCGVLESRCTWKSRTSMMLLRLLNRCCFRNKVMNLRCYLSFFRKKRQIFTRKQIPKPTTNPLHKTLVFIHRHGT